MSKDHAAKSGGTEPPASRYKDELAAPSAGPGTTQPTQGIAPASSKVGEAVERPQYGNVIRRSLDHDEGKDEDDVRPGADDVLAP